MTLLDTPALPPLWLAQLALPLGWAVVLGWSGLSLWQRTGRGGQLALWLAALLPAATAGLPGAYSSSYWLGLSFQQPSLLTVALCASGLVRGLRSRSLQDPSLAALKPSLALPLAGVIAGWVLLLDTFALLPWQVYGWGFGPVALIILLGVALVLWLRAAQGQRVEPGLLVLALVVHAGSRLPDGNAWDAMLDPLLWGALHCRLFHVLWCRMRRR
jgi:hypothetical protein